MNENLDKVLNSSTFALFFMVLDLRLVKIGCRETINFFYFYSHSKIIDIIKRCPDDRNK